MSHDLPRRKMFLSGRPLKTNPFGRCVSSSYSGTPTRHLAAVSRRAHEESKTRAAELLIRMTKAPPSDRNGANTEREEYAAQQASSPSPGGNGGTTNIHRRHDDGGTATARTLGNTDLVKRGGSENDSSAGDDAAEEGASGWGPSGHETLVDVSRRPAQAPRKYAEEELDRYCQSWTTTTASTATKAGPLRLASSGLLSINGGSGGGVRRTPRRVPVRPNSSGNGVTRGRIRGEKGIRSGSASPRAARGQLVPCESLGAR